MTRVRPFVIQGDICYSASPQTVETVENGYLVCEEGRCAGVFRELPQAYRALPLVDCGGKLVVPGLVDLHVHAPQYAFRGLGMDLELLEWLNTHTFPMRTGLTAALSGMWPGVPIPEPVSLPPSTLRLPST